MNSTPIIPVATGDRLSSELGIVENVLLNEPEGDPLTGNHKKGYSLILC